MKFSEASGTKHQAGNVSVSFEYMLVTFAKNYKSLNLFCPIAPWWWYSCVCAEWAKFKHKYTIHKYKHVYLYMGVLQLCWAEIEFFE
jgi:hypothetical protein